MHTSKTQNVARILLGAFLTFAGVSHLTFNRSEFLAQVPKWLPVNPDLTVILSGIVEISLGLALIFMVKNKKWVGIIAAVFFVLIFPGNISQYINKVDAFGLDTDKARLIRLFFQPVLILWALWSTNALKKKN
ncbi:DoxX family membrane protein [Mucilaginibacter sp. PAMB04168]|uniref:DoxX family protein n=1 Tax=Mucilaginibacter sp. PAMB04168 TaxID=3138567 RepID=UPI0031F64A42